MYSPTNRSHPRFSAVAPQTLRHLRSTSALLALSAGLWLSASSVSAATIAKTSDTFPTIVEMNVNDVLDFTLSSGATRSITLINKGLETYNDLDPTKPAQWLIWADILVDGHPHRIIYQPFHLKALYEPKVIDGVRIGLETIKNYGTLSGLPDGSPNAATYKDVRIWVNDATKPVVVSGTAPGTPVGQWFELFQDRVGAPLLGGESPPAWPQRPDYRIRLDRDVRSSTTNVTQIDDKTSWLGRSGKAGEISTVLHTGLDFSMPELTELYGVVAGRVEYDPYGVGRFYYELTRANGDRWEFGSHHCDVSTYGSVSGGHIVPKGASVNVGQIWALSGATGATGDAHMHAQIHFTPSGAPMQVLNPWPFVWQGLENRKIADNVIRAQIQPVGPVATAWMSITFSSAGSHFGPGRNALGYQWYFSDGSTSFQANPTKSFPAGVHQAILVVDDGHLRDAQRIFFTVGAAASANPAPTITLESWASPAMPAVGQTTKFGVKAIGNAGHAVDYTWNFGDGSAAVTTASQTVTHAFPGSGRFVVVVTARDVVTQARSMDYLLLDTSQWPATPGASVNVALGRPATSDSNFSPYVAGMAVDGLTDDAHRWVSANTAADHWVAVDLGTSYTINRAIVETGGSSTPPVSNFLLEASWNGGASWSPITGTQVTGNTSATRTLEFNRISAAWIRLRSTDGTFVRVKELRLYTP